jgi:hypothetical protein
MKRITQEQAKYRLKIDFKDELGLINADAYTLIPSKDSKWDEVTYYTQAIVDPTGTVFKPEWIYVLVNKGIPGICKIGMTTISVTQRTKEINAATGVITPWFSVYKHKCINSREIERRVHSKLQTMGARINNKREGFECSTDLAISIIKEVASEFEIS